MTDKENKIKEIATKCAEAKNNGEHQIGAYTQLHRAGFKDGGDMEIFERYYDELTREKRA